LAIKRVDLTVKRSSVAGTIPSVLKNGELAVNTADGKLFVGDGTTVIDLTEIDHATIQDQRPLGEDGGTSFDKKWNVRTVNTIVHGDNIVSLVGDDFKLIPGEYLIEITAPVEEADEHKLRLFNETQGFTVIEGPNFRTEKVGFARCCGTVVSNGTDLFEIQHYTKKGEDRHGLGKAMKVGSFEVYTEVSIIKVK